MVDIIIEFLAQTMSSEPGYPTSTHSEEESSVGTSVMTEPAPKGPEVRKEPPQIDKAKNNLEAGAGVVLKSSKRAILSTALG